MSNPPVHLDFDKSRSQEAEQVRRDVFVAGFQGVPFLVAQAAMAGNLTAEQARVIGVDCRQLAMRLADDAARAWLNREPLDAAKVEEPAKPEKPAPARVFVALFDADREELDYPGYARVAVDWLSAAGEVPFPPCGPFDCEPWSVCYFAFTTAPSGGEVAVLRSTGFRSRYLARGERPVFLKDVMRVAIEAA